MQRRLSASGLDVQAAFEPLEPRLLLANQPFISEFMADNDNTLVDEDGASSDWIEIHNPTPSSIDLTGWKLRDSTEEWELPGMSIGAGAYRVIFASDKNRRDPLGELHTNFKLSAGGEPLALLDATGSVVSEYDPFPRQLEDISYGIMYDVQGQTSLVRKGAPTRYVIPADGSDGLSWIEPTGFDDSGWNSGTTGFGYGLGAPDGSVELITAQSVWRYLDDGSDQGTGWRMRGFDDSSWAAGPAELGYGDGGEATVVSYGSDSANKHVTTYFRRHFNVDHAWQISELTMGLRRDDGAVVYINGQRLPDHPDYNMPGGAIDYRTFAAGTVGGGSESTYYPFTIDPAGLLVDGDNVIAVEIHQGNRTSSDISFDLTLTGTTSTAGLLETDVEAEMKDVNPSMYLRIPFTVNDTKEFTELYLRTAYDDAYVAYLNGVKVAGDNDPASPQWNSTALSDRPMSDAVTFMGVDLTPFLHLLVDGENLLAVHALNDTVDSDSFLITPELIAQSSIDVQVQYFITPTPGAENIPGVLGMVKDTQFSVDRGFYDQPFSVEITTDTAGAQIRFTLDGSEPTETYGTVYTGPIPVNTTTILRAVGYKPGWFATNVDTQTYIFLDDVLQQSNAPAGFPTSWGGTAADYEMDPEIVNNAQYGATLNSDLLSLPTMSLVMDVEDLFGVSGIYTNSTSQGVNWERPASISMFHPDGSSAFQVNCGARMYGGVGRNANFKKHSFRLMFKGMYGPTKLDYPIFGSTATDRFDTLILRSNFNDAWVWGGARSQYIRDEYVRRLQLQLGDASGHGNFVHLYVNGLYWGLYNPVERPDTSFSASYYGGDKDLWDGINSGAATGESSTASYNAMLSLARQGMSTQEQYQRIQGNNPDGTNNPAYPDYLDMENYANYMLVNFFVGNRDWPGHNWYAGRERTDDSTGFKSYSWDAEWVINMNSGLTENRLGVNNSLAEPYSYLRQNLEFRVLFGDQAHKAFFNYGPFYNDGSANMPKSTYEALAWEVERAIVGESARWGDVVSGSPFTLSHWQNERDYILNTYMPQRPGIVLQQLKDAGLYPNVAAPAFKVNGSHLHGGIVSRGDLLSISAPGGTIYYTLDGTDPRVVGGAPLPGAHVYSGPILLDNSYHVKSRVLSGGQWSALNEAKFYLNVAPSLRVTEIMYNPGQPTAAEIAAGFEDAQDFEYVELTNIGNEPLPLLDVAFCAGIEYTFPATTLLPGEYLVLVKNQAAFEQRYGAGAADIAGEYSGSLGNGGERIMLVAGTSFVIHDFEYDDDWYPVTDGDGFSLTIVDPDAYAFLWSDPASWRPSTAPGGTPGADAEGNVPGSVIINEVLAHTDGGVEDWIELLNTTGEDVDISGWFLSDDGADLTKYQIPANTVIGAGQYLVLDQVNHFGPIANPPRGFALSEFGDDVYLSSNVGGLPGGYREHVDFGATPWGKSVGLHVKSLGGSDFAILEHPTYRAANADALIDALVINELMYHPPDPGAGSGYSDEDFEFVELYNRSAWPVDLRQYSLGEGVGFTFGWYDADDFGNEVWTLEQGATARWQASLTAGQWEVLARWDVLDGEGNLRSLDRQARYEIARAGGSDVVPIDQDANPAGWVSLGTYEFNSGLADVTLTRGSDNPNNWTIADQVKFVKGATEVVVDNGGPGFTTTGSATAALGAGEYVVIVRNAAAFATRYNPAGMTIAGEYSGNLSNDGEKVKLFRAATPEPTGYIPYYRADYVNYDDRQPLWPVEPDGGGFSLSRLDGGEGGSFDADRWYGNDPGNWSAGSAGGTPGLANTYLDTTAPTVPQNLAGQITVAPNLQIHLNWDESSDPQTWVDHYKIYRNGAPIGTAQGVGYYDTTVSAATPYAYQVSAVNRDGYESRLSTGLPLSIPGIEAVYAPEDTVVELLFSEPLEPTSAQTAGNYAITGGSVTWAALGADGRTVTLTVTPMQADQAYTVVVSNVGTASGTPMPPGMEVAFVYSPQGAGFILREYWTGIPGQGVNELINHPSFPDNPTGSDLPTVFEAPTDWGDNYGQRMWGYVHPPETGDYVFWIASDDNGQLFLSTDRDPANKVLIASVPGWTSSRLWTRYPEQQSQPIHLEAGRRYFIEAIQKENTGGDNLAVGWQLPGGAMERPIPGERLSPFEGFNPIPTVTIDPLLTNDPTPQLTGTVSDAASAIVVTVDGNPYTAINHGNGRWTVPDDTIDPPLADGTYDVGAAATSLDQQTGVDDTDNELTVDTQAPAVTVDATVATNQSPALAGTVDDPTATVVAVVAGNEYTAVNNGDGTWALAGGQISPALAYDTYDVQARATDPAGNVGLDATTDELVVQPPAPIITIAPLITNDTAPPLTGAVDDPDATVVITVEGTEYPAVNNGDGTWTLADDTISPALAEGTYDVSAAATDDLQQTGTDHTVGELVVDLTAAAVTVDPLGTADTTPELSGTVDDGDAAVAVTVGGSQYAATNNGDGTWTLADGEIGAPLAEGRHDVQVTATDTAGNVGTDATADELHVDSTPPPAPGNLAAAAVSPSRIDLTWDEALDGQSGTDHYVVYRDGSPIATVPAPGYSDTGLVETTTYSYEITAVNTYGSEGPASAPLPASPAPSLVSAEALDATHLLVTFGKAVDQATAEVAANYHIVDDQARPMIVAAANRLPDPATVELTLGSVIVEEVWHGLTVVGVEDLAGSPVPPGSQTTFLFRDVDPSMLSWWTFDDQADAGADVTENGHRLQVFGADWVADGHVGGAMRFDGSVGDYLLDDDGEMYLNGLGAFTVSMWIQADATGTDRGFFTTRDPGRYDCINLRFDADAWGGGATDTLTAFVSTNSEDAVVEGPAGLQSTEWMHVALGWVSDHVPVLYVNGRPQAASFDTGALGGAIANTTKVIIGKGEADAGSSWIGLIDDVRIYGRRLTDEEVEAIANIKPVVQNDAYTVERNGSLSVDAAAGVLANDTDPDDAPEAMAAIRLIDVAHGRLTLNADGSFDYAPAGGYSGLDGFSYRAYDGMGYSKIATVSIDVQAPAVPVVTVDPLATNDATPQLTGTVDDASATVTVTVGGVRNTAVNNGDGTWTLPDNTIAPPLADGAYNVEAAATSTAQLTGYDATADELTVDATAPTVEAVFVGSTGWSQAFLDELGDSGYAMPSGGDQLDELPWVNLDQVTIVFSEQTNVAQEHLSLYGVRLSEYTVAAFDYDSDSFTATWTLSQPVEADKLLMVIPDGVADATGNALDGEWTDGISSYSSGDGQAGGDFGYRINVLPGDADQSGEVRSSDVIKVRRKGNTAADDAGYSMYHDIDGNGEIRSSDVIKVRRKGNTALPAGEPTCSPAPPAAPTAPDALAVAAMIGSADAPTPAGPAGPQPEAAAITLVEQPDSVLPPPPDPADLLAAPADAPVAASSSPAAEEADLFDLLGESELTTPLGE